MNTSALYSSELVCHYRLPTLIREGWVRTMRTLRISLALLALLFAVSATAAESASELPSAHELFAEARRSVGAATTLNTQVQVVYTEGPFVTHLEADLWSVPGAPMRIEVTAPEELAGIVGASYAGQIHVLEHPPGFLSHDLVGVIELFSTPRDILGTFFEGEEIWAEAEVVAETEYQGRPTFELHVVPHEGIKGVLVIDREYRVPLHLYVTDGTHSEYVFSLEALETDERGTLTKLHLSAFDGQGELVLEPWEDFLIPKWLRVEATIGIGLEFTTSRARTTEIPAGLLVDVADLPESDGRLEESFILMAEGRYVEAIRVLEELTRDDPYNVPAYVQLGYGYLVLGDWMGAVAAFEQALVLQPSNLIALNNLAYVYIDMELDIERGVEIAREVVLLRPGHAAYLDTLGWGLHKLGEHEEALYYIEQALELEEPVPGDPGHVEGLYHYAVVLRALGREDEAREVVEKALELGVEYFPLNELARELGMGRVVR